MGITIITAGCGGIGAELTKHLLEKGHTVIPTTRDVKNGLAFIKKLGDIAERCYPMCLELNNQDSIENFINSVRMKYGKIDNLINNAVCRDAILDAYEMDMQKWEEHYRVNVFGTAQLSAKVADELINKNGSIVNISSFYSVNVPDNRVYEDGTIPTSLIYASSKAALNYITKYMAVRYAQDNIIVNAILAGGVGDNLRQTDGFVDKYCYRTPMNKMAKISDFNSAIDFFVSENNRYCTGQLLAVDGGWGLL